jgi:predicted NAD/FAD-dependent oxidoreductase
MSMRMSQPMVVVVGAGVAGLACARELERRGVPVVVLERARGVGGRCATRWIEGQPVDFGLPFLHAASREFTLELNALPDEGRVPGWPRHVWEPRLACQPDAFHPGRRRMARVSGVNELPRHLGAGLDVRHSTRVVSLASESDRVVVVTRDGACFAAPFVVLATEPTEALALAAPLVRDWPGGTDGLARLAVLPIVRTLTLIAGYPRSVPMPGFDLGHPLEATLVHTLVFDDTKRAEPRDRVLVVHARHAFSTERWDCDEAEWSAELLWETAELLGAWAAHPRWLRAHRWHCARVRRGDSLGDLLTFETQSGACVSLCGDAFAAADGLEGAYLSGMALAEQIATLPRVREMRRPSTAR